jgi:hypothetical protein
LVSAGAGVVLVVEDQELVAGATKVAGCVGCGASVVGREGAAVLVPEPVGCVS